MEGGGVGYWMVSVTIDINVAMAMGGAVSDDAAMAIDVPVAM